MSLSLGCWVTLGCGEKPTEVGSDIQILTSDSGKEPADELQEFSFRQIFMGMPVKLTVWASSQAQAEQACRKAFARILELEQVFSDYDPQSEISQGGVVRDSVKVSDDLSAVLGFAQAFQQETDGAFDVTAKPVIQLWRDTRRHSRLPSPEDVHQALSKMGSEKIFLDQATRSVTLSISGLQFDFGGVAKGYIGDQVLQVLKENGISSAKYWAGGDIVVGAAPPHQAGWDIEIPPMGVMSLTHCGISISGDTQQFVEIEGVRYSHVVDPRTGIGVTNRRQAIVTAPCGMLSDALATAGCVMEPTKFAHLVQSKTGVKGWLVDSLGKVNQVGHSEPSQ